MTKTGKRIPIADAKQVGKTLGYSQVIIVAFDKRTSTTSVCTWGEDEHDCAQAADGGNFVKKALGWPPEACNAKPARQIKREQFEAMEREIAELKRIGQHFVDIITEPNTDDTVNIVRFTAASMLIQKHLEEHPLPTQSK